MGRSRLGGVPTALAPPQARRQLALGVAPVVPAREILFPGAVKIAGWLSQDAQRSLAAGFRERALPPAGLRHPRVFGGPSRRIHHGVPRVLEGTAPQGLGRQPGRVSITIRETGL
jgi:hypothetical protein